MLNQLNFAVEPGRFCHRYTAISSGCSWDMLLYMLWFITPYEGWFISSTWRFQRNLWSSWHYYWRLHLGNGCWYADITLLLWFPIYLWVLTWNTFWQHYMMTDQSGLMFTVVGICFPSQHFMTRCLPHLLYSMRWHKTKFQLQEVWNIEFSISKLHFIFIVHQFISRMIMRFTVIQIRLRLRFQSLMVWVLWRMFLAHSVNCYHPLHKKSNVWRALYFHPSTLPQAIEGRFWNS